MSGKSNEVCEALVTELEKAKHGLFSTRDNTDEALEFAREMGAQYGMKDIDMLAVVMVYHNTLLDTIIKSLK